MLVPYWKETGKFALEHGVTKICFEMHPDSACTIQRPSSSES